MKNKTKNNALDIPTKEQVIETVIDIFVREIGFIERKEVSRTTNIDEDFYIYTDDISLFLLAVEKHFNIKPAPKDWLTIDPTIEGIASFVLRHLSKKLEMCHQYHVLIRRSNEPR